MLWRKLIREGNGLEVKRLPFKTEGLKSGGEGDILARPEGVERDLQISGSSAPDTGTISANALRWELHII